MTPTSKSSQAMTPCAECGMPCAPGEYHPYAACLMFKACRNSETVRANLEAIKDHALAAHPSQAQAAEAVISADKCAQDVYKNGQSIGYFDIPKETANAICAGIQAVTGARVDWHYFAGRVHMKALPASPVASEREGLTVQDVRLLLIRHADSYAEWDDATLEKVDFGQYGFLAFARALATRTGSDK